MSISIGNPTYTSASTSGVTGNVVVDYLEAGDSGSNATWRFTAGGLSYPVGSTVRSFAVGNNKQITVSASGHSDATKNINVVDETLTTVKVNIT